MTTQAGVEKKERDFLAQCVGDAYQMLDLLPGVDPHGPTLVWQACRSVPAADPDGAFQSGQRAVDARQLPSAASFGPGGGL
jgi:hypothetical protein